MVLPGNMVLPAAWRTALRSIDAVLRHRAIMRRSARFAKKAVPGNCLMPSIINTFLPSISEAAEKPL